MNLSGRITTALTGVSKETKYIAGADGGDWFLIPDVNFGSGMDSVSIRYGKGDTSDVGFVLRLDTLDGPRIASVLSLPTTNSWNTWRKYTFPAASQSGTHDVYVRITGDGTLGNIDCFQFGRGQRWLMQSEKADAMQGVSVNGKHIEVVEGGDWIRFDDVKFGSGFTNALVRYAKGNKSSASVTVHLDSPIAPAISTINLWAIFVEFYQQPCLASGAGVSEGRVWR